MKFGFLLEEEVFGEDVLRALHPNTRSEFLSFVLVSQYELDSSTKQSILAALLDCAEVECARELVRDVCTAFEKEESEPWLPVLAGLVLNHFLLKKEHEPVFASTLAWIEENLPVVGSSTPATGFVLPKQVVPRDWAYLQSDCLPSAFDLAETMRNEDFTTKSLLPERFVDHKFSNRRDHDLVNLFFTPGITLEKLTEIYIDQTEVMQDGKPQLISTYLKMDPTDSEKKVWNIVRRVEQAKRQKPTEDTAGGAGE